MNNKNRWPWVLTTIGMALILWVLAPKFRRGDLFRFRSEQTESIQTIMEASAPTPNTEDMVNSYPLSRVKMGREIVSSYNSSSHLLLLPVRRILLADSSKREARSWGEADLFFSASLSLTKTTQNALDTSESTIDDSVLEDHSIDRFAVSLDPANFDSSGEGAGRSFTSYPSPFPFESESCSADENRWAIKPKKDPWVVWHQRQRGHRLQRKHRKILRVKLRGMWERNLALILEGEEISLREHEQQGQHSWPNSQDITYYSYKQRPLSRSQQRISWEHHWRNSQDISYYKREPRLLSSSHRKPIWEHEWRNSQDIACSQPPQLSNSQETAKWEHTWRNSEDISYYEQPPWQLSNSQRKLIGKHQWRNCEDISYYKRKLSRSQQRISWEHHWRNSQDISYYP